MKAVLSAAGRAALRDGAAAFLVLAAGILNAPDLNQARALAAAASIAALTMSVRAVRVFVPQIATAISNTLRIPTSLAEVGLTALTTFLMGFLALVEGVLSAPDLTAAKAAGVAGLLALGTGLIRVVSAVLTPGETPAPGAGIGTPAPPPVE